jgi:hypothetical protein
MFSAIINVAASYYRTGRFKFAIQAAETVSQFSPVYYDTATDKVTETESETATLIGVAVEAGSGTAGYVVVQLTPAMNTGLISKEQLDSGILPSHVTKYAGTFAAGGTDTTETKVIAGALSTDIARIWTKTLGGDVTSVVRRSVAADGSISATLNTPMGSGSPVLAYEVLRAIA